MISLEIEKNRDHSAFFVDFMDLFNEADDRLAKAETLFTNDQFLEAFQTYKQGMVILQSIHESIDNEDARNFLLQILKPLVHRLGVICSSIPKLSLSQEQSSPDIKRINEDKLHHDTNTNSLNESRIFKKDDLMGNTMSSLDPEMEVLVSKFRNHVILIKPDINFNDVIGLEAVKLALKTILVAPSQYPHLVPSTQCRDVLLYGPPGCGKSYLARAAVGEMKNHTFINIDASVILSKFVGEQEKNMKAMFHFLRRHKPCVVFLDEVEQLFRERSNKDHGGIDGLKTLFLIESDGVEGRERNEGITILGCTNMPWLIDLAIRRRFKLLYVGAPTEKERALAFEKCFLKAISSFTHTLNKSSYLAIAKCTQHFSMADIQKLASDVAAIPFMKTQSSNYFKLVNAQWQPVRKFTPGAEEMKFESIDPKAIRVPTLATAEVMQYVPKVKGSLDTSQVDGGHNVSNMLTQLEKFRIVNGGDSFPELLKNDPSYKNPFDCGRHRNLNNQSHVHSRIDSFGGVEFFEKSTLVSELVIDPLFRFHSKSNAESDTSTTTLEPGPALLPLRIIPHANSSRPEEARTRRLQFCNCL